MFPGNNLVRKVLMDIDTSPMGNKRDNALLNYPDMLISYASATKKYVMTNSSSLNSCISSEHDDVMKWKYAPEQTVE